MQPSSSRWCASALIAAMVLAGRSCAAKTSAAAGGDAAPTHAGLGPSSLYFRQLCPGDEIATSGSELHAMARSMNNFIYVIGDRDTREAVVIDACWDVEGVVEAVRADGMNITKAFATHYHFDHIGGLRGGIRIPGIKELSEMGIAVSVPLLEIDDAATSTGTMRSKLSPLDDKQCIKVGNFVLEWLSTPGHSPGGMCVKVSSTKDKEWSTKTGETSMAREVGGGEEGDRGMLLLVLSGDTLFPGSCGRLDLPGSDAALMYDSLQKLAGLPDSLPVFPGHGYGGRQTTVGREKRHGLLRPMTRVQWLTPSGTELG